MRLKRNILLSALLLLLVSLPLYFSSVRAEAMYQISESELSQLETNSQKLEQSNQNKQKLLTEQKAQLEKANELISQSQAQNQAMKQSLDKTNKYLNEYEKEVKHKIQVKTRQRNLWIAISGGLLIALVEK